MSLHDWVRRIGPLRVSGEPEEAALRTDNLISGMIDAQADASDTLPWD